MTRSLFDSNRPRLEALEDRLVPSTMAGNYPDGVWRFDTSAGWNHISNMQATRLDVDDAGDVYGKFSDGLWRWNAATASWAKLSSLTIQQFQVTASGVLYGDFGTAGVWRWAPSSGWMKLSDFDVGGMTVSDSDAFFGQFSQSGAVGLWRWTPAAGWSLLTANRADTLYSDAAGEFVGSFHLLIAAGQEGTWRWNPTKGWARLSSAVATVSVSNDGTIYESRDLLNVWRAAPGAASFTQIGFNQGPAVYPYALPDGGLFEYRYDNNATPQGTGWYWSPSLPGLGFVQVINDASRFAALVIGKDGDMFFNDDNTGAGYWSLQSAYHTLADNSQVPNLLVSQR
jgi:hypothetical protein